MKQAVNQTEAVKQTLDKVIFEPKVQEQSKTEVNRLLKLKETNLFHRYLEANCDCVCLTASDWLTACFMMLFSFWELNVLKFCFSAWINTLCHYSNIECNLTR